MSQLQIHFGQIARSLRIEAGFTGAQLAKALGVSQGFLADVEHGRRMLTRERRITLGSIVQIDPDVLHILAGEATDAQYIMAETLSLSRAIAIAEKINRVVKVA